MKDSCISHRPRSSLVILRQDYLDICEGDLGAALILSILEHWTNVKLESAEQAGIENAIRAKEQLAPIEADLWIYKTYAQFTEDSLGLLKDHQIRKGLKFLLKQNLIEKRNNPRYTWDRTLQYRLLTENVQARLDDPTFTGNGSMRYRQRMEALPVTNPSVTGNGTIPEITTKTTTETVSLDDFFEGRGASVEKPNKAGFANREEALQAGMGLAAMSSQPAIMRLNTQAGWRVRVEDEARLILAFSEATGIPYPSDKPERSNWLGGVRQHLEAFGDVGLITRLYKEAWGAYRDLVMSGDLTVTHPKALTTKMRHFMLIGKADRDESNYDLKRLEQAGVIEFATVELSNGDVTGHWRWTVDGARVNVKTEVQRLIQATKELGQ